MLQGSTGNIDHIELAAFAKTKHKPSYSVVNMIGQPTPPQMAASPRLPIMGPSADACCLVSVEKPTHLHIFQSLLEIHEYQGTLSAHGMDSPPEGVHFMLGRAGDVEVGEVGRHGVANIASGKTPCAACERQGGDLNHMHKHLLM